MTLSTIAMYCPGVGSLYHIKKQRDVYLRLKSGEFAPKDSKVEDCNEQLSFTQEVLRVQKEFILPTVCHVAIGFLVAALLSWNAVGIAVLTVGLGHFTINTGFLIRNARIEHTLASMVAAGVGS